MASAPPGEAWATKTIRFIFMNIKIQSGIFLREHLNPYAKADIWLVHGLGESSLSFREAFNSVLADYANIFAPDLPGFGVSPRQDFDDTLEGFSALITKLVKEQHFRRPVYILGHSAGGIIGLRTCKALKSLVTGFINVEGNLTEADGFLSRLAKSYESAEDFYQFCLSRTRNAMAEDVAFNRYYASFNFCQPESFFDWAKATFAATGEDKAGKDFVELPMEKVFFWGDKSTAKKTRDFINSNNISQVRFHGAGHWPMIDQPDLFYQEVRKFIGG